MMTVVMRGDPMVSLWVALMELMKVVSMDVVMVVMMEPQKVE
jgi:hypothetical protein